MILDSLLISSSMVFQPSLFTSGKPGASKRLPVIIRAARFCKFCKWLISVRPQQPQTERCLTCSVPFSFKTHSSEPSAFQNGMEPSSCEQLQKIFCGTAPYHSVPFYSVSFSCERGLIRLQVVQAHSPLSLLFDKLWNIGMADPGNVEKGSLRQNSENRHGAYLGLLLVVCLFVCFQFVLSRLVRISSY